MVELAVVYSTFASRRDAERVAAALLDERLVACANMLPVTSLYDWKGARTRDREVAAFFKTTKARAQQAARRLAELHPYEVPCVEQWPVTRGLPVYASWVAGATAARPQRVARKGRPRP